MRINRRKLLQAIGVSPALLGASPMAARAERSREKGSSAEAKLVGLNPKGIPPAIALSPLAPRLTSLDGKTIYMVDIGFNNGDVFFNEMQRWFQANMPSVKTVYARKAGAYPQDDPKLWAEIRQKGNGVIMGVGH